eukprot:TRINITY_DN10723_c0_g1_i1.p1 TRINITY_DN10723_c0_g1~~TRINITY_DN10723_c0_g1_i1.p1  ORF type:complete len:359 (-),score=39.52 TRINITY_DN10723_c0_g1_i1:705-1709(-)
MERSDNPDALIEALQLQVEELQLTLSIKTKQLEALAPEERKRRRSETAPGHTTEYLSGSNWNHQTLCHFGIHFLDKATWHSLPGSGPTNLPPMAELVLTNFPENLSELHGYTSEPESTKLSDAELIVIQDLKRLTLLIHTAEQASESAVDDLGKRILELFFYRHHIVRQRRELALIMSETDTKATADLQVLSAGDRLIRSLVQTDKPHLPTSKNPEAAAVAQAIAAKQANAAVRRGHMLIAKSDEPMFFVVLSGTLFKFYFAAVTDKLSRLVESGESAPARSFPIYRWQNNGDSYDWSIPKQRREILWFLARIHEQVNTWQETHQAIDDVPVAT